MESFSQGACSLRTTFRYPSSSLLLYLVIVLWLALIVHLLFSSGKEDEKS